MSTEEEVEGFVGEVRANFHDPSADAVASLSRFESGEGDVILTYEQTLLSAIKAGADYEIVVPDSTVLVENPVAVVDRYVDRRGTREVAEAFVAFLFTTQAQELFAQSGFRTLDPRIAEKYPFPAVKDLFTVRELGGWHEVSGKVAGRRSKSSAVWTTTGDRP